MNKITDKLLILVSFYLLQLGLYAQEKSGPDYGSKYFDQETFTKNFEEKTGKFLESGNYLTIEDAEKQIVEKEGKVIEIKKVSPRRKKLSEKQVYSLLKESAVVFGISYDCGYCDLAHINPTSGYIIGEDGLCVTNYHVIESYIRGKEQNLSLQVMTASGYTYPVVEIVTAYKNADLVVVKLDTKGDKLTPIPFGEDAEVGDKIHILSNPSNMFFYFSTGIVARNYLMTPSQAKDNKVSPEMQVTADYAVGSSGGPVADIKGNLVATVSNTKSIYTNSSANINLQMVVKGTKPVVLLKEVVRFKK